MNTDSVYAWGFWDLPLWHAYCAAYSGRWTNCRGELGNLVAVLGSEDEMWRRIRKGHQADIRFAGRQYVAVNSFDGYERCHKAAFPEVRSQRTYDIQREIVEDGYGLALTNTGGAAALFYLHGEGAYYASAARTTRDRGAAHQLVWIAMLLLSDKGHKWLDFGPVPMGGPRDKDSVGDFKRGFGPEVVHGQAVA